MITSQFDYRKATQALTYFASKYQGRINVLMAMKLIWAADRFHLRKYGRTMLNDTYFAMRYGPVASGTYDLAKGLDPIFVDEGCIQYRDAYLAKDGLDVVAKREPDLNILSESEIESMDFALANFGDTDRFDLSEMTHDYPEWAKFKPAYRALMSYTDFFSDPDREAGKFKIGDKFKMDEQLLEGTRQVFKEEQMISQNWY